MVPNLKLTPRTSLKTDTGAILVVFGILAFIFLILIIIVGMVVGLDKKVEGGDPSKSMFSKDAKIHDVMNTVNEKKEKFITKLEERRERKDAAERLNSEGASGEAPTADTQSTTPHKAKDLEDIQRRLANEPN